VEIKKEPCHSLLCAPSHCVLLWFLGARHRAPLRSPLPTLFG
jgi:hypothetical protein